MITTATNMNAALPNSYSYPGTGWKPVFFDVGTPTSTSQTNNASPSLDSQAMEFSVTGPAYVDVLWTYIAGINDAAEYFNSDFWVYIDSVTYPLAQAFEFDMFNFSTTDNINYMCGMQWNRVTSKWQISSNDSWVDTIVTAGLTSGGWTHVQQQTHRVPGDLLHVYYDWVAVNGVTYWFSGTPGLSVQELSVPLVPGWTSAVGWQAQLDIASVPATISMIIDQANFIASPSGAPPPPPPPPVSSVITTTILYPPPLRGSKLSVPEQHYLLTLQNHLPLIEVDTSAGNSTAAPPPAGLNASTGQSNQNQELVYKKVSADANSFTLSGTDLPEGPIVLSVKYDYLKIKSNGTVWWLTS